MYGSGGSFFRSQYPVVKHTSVSSRIFENKGSCSNCARLSKYFVPMYCLLRSSGGSLASTSRAFVGVDLKAPSIYTFLGLRTTVTVEALVWVKFPSEYMLRGVGSGMWLFVVACLVLAEEVDPSLDWTPRRGAGRAQLGLLARGVPDSQLEEEGDPAEVRVAKRQAADGRSLDWQLMLEDGGGEARTRVKRAQLEPSSDEDRGELEAMQEEFANDGVVGGDSVEEEHVEWLERRESPGLAGLSDSVAGGEVKEEKGGGDEEDSEVALDKNDPKPPK